MSDTPDNILDEFTRIMAALDQVQADIDTAREKFKDLEHIQRQLDLDQIKLDAQMSKLKIAKGYLRRNFL